MAIARKRTVRSSGRSGDQRFDFAVPLVKLRKGGPVAIVATLNEIQDIQMSLVPMDGGRHWLQRNARTRGELDQAGRSRARCAVGAAKSTDFAPAW
jgi:hypothetical protein